MDDVLHAERLDGKRKRTHRASIDTLPDGAMIALDGEAFAVRGQPLLRWTPSGYDATRAAPARPRGRRADAARRCSRCWRAATRRYGIRAPADAALRRMKTMR